MMLINRPTIMDLVAAVASSRRLTTAARSHSRIFKLFACLVLMSSVSFASEPTRVWVDASGTFTIEASLEGIDAGTVTLVRPDGSRVRIAESQLGYIDRDYVDQWRSRPRTAENSLRFSPPKPRQIPPLPKLALPASSKILEEGQALTAIPQSEELESEKPESTKPDSRSNGLATPGPIPADPLANSFEVGLGHLAIGQLHAYDHCSAPIAINSKEGTFVAVSVSTGLMGNPDEANRIIRFDSKSGESKIVWLSKLPLTLLDHNPNTKLTLVLDGHSVRGHGGQLAIISDWDAELISIGFHRSIPESDQENVRRSFRPSQVLG